MEQQTLVSSNLTGAQPNHGLETKGSGFHLEALVHPWRVFTHPSEVLAHPALSKQEKRAVLASWASDAYAVESAPALRCPPGSETPVPLADIMGALRTLDTEGPPRCAGTMRNAHAGGLARSALQAGPSGPLVCPIGSGGCRRGRRDQEARTIN